MMHRRTSELWIWAVCLQRPQSVAWLVVFVGVALSLAWGTAVSAQADVVTIAQLREIVQTGKSAPGQDGTKAQTLPMARSVGEQSSTPPWLFEADLNVTSGMIESLLIGRVAGSVRASIDDVPVAFVTYESSYPLELGFRPLYAVLPSPLTGTGHVLRLTVWPDASGRAGLSELQLGAYPVVERQFYRFWFENNGFYIIAATAATLAFFLTLIIWRGTREVAYRDFAVASACIMSGFALRLFIGHGVVSPFVAFFIVASQLAFVGFVVQSALRLAPWVPAVMKGVPGKGLLIALVLTALACICGQRWLLHSLSFAGQFTGLVVAILIWYYAATPLKSHLFVFLGAMILAAIAGAIDLALKLSVSQGFGGPPLQLLASLIVLVSIFVFAIQQYLEASYGIRDWNRHLKERIHDTETELQQVYDRLLEREKHTAIMAERHRILKEMHDGVGGQLVATMSLAQHEETPRGELLNALDVCLTELRLAIDSLDPSHSDLLMALATLRSRLAPVLDRSGIALGWSVRDLEDRKTMTPDQVLQIFRILQEGVTNVIKHSHATRADLVCGYCDRRGLIWLTLRDNGFCPAIRNEQSTGHGLRNMRSRAEAIGAHLSVRLGRRSAPGTRVRLIWKSQ